MIKDGVIDEVIFLEKKYTRKPNSMSSIGILETLETPNFLMTKENYAEYKTKKKEVYMFHWKRKSHQIQPNLQKDKTLLIKANLTIYKVVIF